MPSHLGVTQAMRVLDVLMYSCRASKPLCLKRALRGPVEERSETENAVIVAPSEFGLLLLDVGETWDD